MSVEVNRNINLSSKADKLKALIEKANNKPLPVLKAPAGKSAAKKAPEKKPEPINHGKVVNYYVEYEDGTAMLAQGKHAHLIYRFTMEAQKLATSHAFAYYEGPPLTEMPKADAVKLITDTLTVDVKTEVK